LDYAIFATEEYDAELSPLHEVEEVSSPAKTEEANSCSDGATCETAVRIGKPTGKSFNSPWKRKSTS